MLLLQLWIDVIVMDSTRWTPSLETMKINRLLRSTRSGAYSWNTPARGRVSAYGACTMKHTHVARHPIGTSRCIWAARRLTSALPVYHSVPAGPPVRPTECTMHVSNVQNLQPCAGFLFIHFHYFPFFFCLAAAVHILKNSQINLNSGRENGTLKTSGQKT